MYIQHRFLLYVIYFPPHKKVNAFVHDLHLVCLPSRSFEWALTLLFRKIIVGYLLVCTSVTIVLLAAFGRGDQEGAAGHWILVFWAGLLGILNMLLSLIQYIPQLIETFIRKVEKEWSTLLDVLFFCVCVSRILFYFSLCKNSP